MRIDNATALSVVQDERGIFVKVFYDIEKALILNKAKTYRQSFDEDIPEGRASSLFVHELNEGLVRHAKLMVRGQVFQANNAIGFWPFLKALFIPQKEEPQTVAHFILPELSACETLDFVLAEDYKKSIRMESFPWVVLERESYRETLISPLLFSLQFYPLSRMAQAILCYPASFAKDYIIDYGELNEC
jgi:hypothetical protein